MRTGALGSLASFDVGTRIVERVGIRSDDLAKRILRFDTSVGEIGLRFEGADRISDGDVIFADDDLVVAVALEADDVLSMRPETIAIAIALAHALGNRHLPIHVEDGAIVVRYDPLLEALAAEHGAAVTRERRVLARPFRHAHAPHDHG